MTEWEDDSEGSYADVDVALLAVSGRWNGLPSDICCAKPLLVSCAATS